MGSSAAERGVAVGVRLAEAVTAPLTTVTPSGDVRGKHIHRLRPQRCLSVRGRACSRVGKAPTDPGTEVGLIVAAAAIVGVVILGLMGVLALFA